MSEDLLGHAALVTGGSRGIGRASALALARRGADVVVGYVANEAAAHAVCAEVAALGRRAIARRADVRVPAEADALVAAALEGLGRLDVLVNAAGVLREGFLMLAPDAQLLMAGWVDDELERTADGWRIVVRRWHSSWSSGNPAVLGR